MSTPNAESGPGVEPSSGYGRPTRLAVLWNASGISDPTAAFGSTGAHVASAALAPALARYGGFRNVDVFVRPIRVEAGRQQFEGLPASVYGAESSIAGICPLSDLPAMLRERRYEVIHDSGTDLVRASYVRSQLSGQVFPVTCSQHGISYSSELYSQFVSLLTAPVLPCDAIVCLTESARYAMQKRLQDVAERYCRAWDRPPPALPRLELIPWGVDSQRFAPRGRTAARHDLNLPPDRTIVLCVGRVRIEDKMDWTTLLVAFQQLKRRTKTRPLLVLAGATFSDYGREVVGQAEQLGLQGDVRTFFNLPQASLASLYAASDVFVSLTDSPSESFGLTIVEAMACGLPVVASDWNGYKEIIVHGETGFKVRTDWADCLGEIDVLAPFLGADQHHLHVGQSVSVDLAQLVDHLSGLLENEELRERMGRKGRARAEAFYAWPVVAKQWGAMWAELAAIARTLEPQGRREIDFLLPSYFEHFAHYASRIVDKETTVRLAPRGRDLLGRRTPLLLHPLSQGFLEARTIYASLSALKSAGWLTHGLAVGELLAILRRTHQVESDRGMMHMMWMAKYGLVSFGDTDDEPGPCLHDPTTDSTAMQ